MKLAIASLGLTASFLGNNWPEAKSRLQHDIPFLQGNESHPHLVAPSILSGPEKRRATPITRLAIQVALEAVRSSNYNAEELHTIFTSSIGDGLTEGKLLHTLGTEPQHLSPVQFHNSVHNATVGYWSIGTKAQLPATSLAAGTYSFAVGLLKSVMQIQHTQAPGLLVAYDMPFEEPLNAIHAVEGMFGVALILSPSSHAPGGRNIKITQVKGHAQTPQCQSVNLTEMYNSHNSAAKSLPLLEALAQSGSGEVLLPLAKELSLKIEVDVI